MVNYDFIVTAGSDLGSNIVLSRPFGGRFPYVLA